MRSKPTRRVMAPPPSGRPKLSTSTARRRAVRLRAGTEAHYRDAAYYDHAYRRRRDDVRFYAEQARQRGGPVLELGVGSGRVALAIAQSGIDVVGVDRMPSMLTAARARLDRQAARVRERVSLRRGDLLRVRLGRRFPLVIAPFNVFMHLYTRRDVERALATVHAHLAPRGRLVFDVLMPDLRTLARNPSRLYRSRPFRHPVHGKRYGYAEAFGYDPVTQVQFVSMLFEPEGAPEDAFVTPLAHRQFFPAELEALLHYNGLRIEARYGGFDKRPLQGDSESQIVIAKPSPR